MAKKREHPNIKSVMKVDKWEANLRGDVLKLCNVVCRTEMKFTNGKVEENEEACLYNFSSAAKRRLVV